MMTFVRRLGSIMLRPRTTMREILDAPQRRILPLLLLATLSAFVGNANDNARGALAKTPRVWLIVAAALIIAAIVMIGLFYLFAWIAQQAGRFLEGRGTYADVRTALAWGLAPVIWALLYRIPAAVLGLAQGPGRMKSGPEGFRFDPGQLSGGCALTLAIGLLELATFVWYVVVSSRVLGEAHRFSSLRGFGTLVIVGITPLVITIAAVMAFL